jgi:hypothetical protein
MNEQQNQQGQTMQTVNAPFLSSSALQMRLETKELLDETRAFFCGEKVFYAEDGQGGVKIIKKKLGKRLMNETGVSNLINNLALILNPSTVQGNYTEEFWREECRRKRKAFAGLVVANRLQWEIDPTAMRSITEALASAYVSFLSRPVDNKERESYSNTIRSVESSTMQTQGSGFLNKVGIS